MKKFIIIAILLISNFGIFGGANTGGEENTNVQEILKNEIVQEVRVVEEQNGQEENTLQIADEIENKQDESRTEQKEQVTENKETPKKENTAKPKETNNVVSVKQETKKVEQKQQESKVQEQKKEEQQITVKEKIQETKQEIKQTQKSETKQCTNAEHAKISGNTNKWFNTQEEAIAFANAEQKKWGEKWTNFEIDDDEYDKKCPYSHKEWTCPHCKKWTLELYYRKK